MTENLTRRELLLWGLGFGAAGIVAAASGIALSRGGDIVGDIAQLSGLSEPDDSAPPKRGGIEITTPSDLAHIIKRSETTPVFMKIYKDGCLPCDAMTPAFKEVAGRYDPNDILFAQYKRTYDKEGLLPEPPELKRWGIAGVPLIKVIYQGKNVYTIGATGVVPMRGEGGAERFEIMVEGILNQYCRGCAYLKKKTR